MSFETARLISSQVDFARPFVAGVLQGPQTVTYQRVSSTGTTSSNMTFNVLVPNLTTGISRRIILKSRVNLAITCTPSGANGTTVLDIGNLDAPSSFPLHRICDSMSLTINGLTTTVQMRKAWPGLRHLGGDELLKACNSTPSFPDQAKTYDSLVGSNRNPLTGALSSDGQFHRGAYVWSATNNTVVSSGNSQVVFLSYDICEPLLISPLLFDKLQQAMYGIGTIGVQLVFSSLARMWSHAVQASSASTVAITNIQGGTSTSDTLVWSNPELILEYLSCGAGVDMPPTQVLPHRRIAVEDSNESVIASGETSTVPGATKVLQSQTFQLNSIPSMVLIFAKEPDRVEDSTSPDALFAITNISVNFGNQSSLLGTCPMHSLWELSQKNGISKSWLDWSGRSLATTGSSGTYLGSGNVVYTTGSVLALSFGQDLGIPDNFAPSSEGVYQFSCQATVDVLGTAAAKFAQLRCVFLYDTAMVTTQGTTSVKSGLLNQQDVAAAMEKPGYSYEGVKAEGGSWLTSLSHGIAKRASKIGAIAKLGKELVDSVRAGDDGGAFSGGASSGGAIVYKGHGGSVKKGRGKLAQMLK